MAASKRHTATGVKTGDHVDAEIRSDKLLRRLARKKFGMEAARVTLGHSSAVMSEIDAERDLDAARAVIAKIGRSGKNDEVL